MLGRQSFVQNLVLIGQGVLSRRTLEKRPFPLKASIAYTTLPCANALACDPKKLYRYQIECERGFV
jgi:hypothetical protein